MQARTEDWKMTLRPEPISDRSEILNLIAPDKELRLVVMNNAVYSHIIVIEGNEKGVSFVKKRQCLNKADARSYLQQQTDNEVGKTNIGSVKSRRVSYRSIIKLNATLRKDSLALSCENPSPLLHSASPESWIPLIRDFGSIPKGVWAEIYEL